MYVITLKVSVVCFPGMNFLCINNYKKWGNAHSYRCSVQSEKISCFRTLYFFFHWLNAYEFRTAIWDTLFCTWNYLSDKRHAKVAVFPDSSQVDGMFFYILSFWDIWVGKERFIVTPLPPWMLSWRSLMFKHRYKLIISMLLQGNK